ncbi:helix-turn-helix domain-containing protein [Chitinophaga agrisoli]|uniref:Helix-turn-helix domain-containing protein n=1 Tax=Chitinophaga agrisoli TaxID=2607653 RepID=A0A5B2W4F9_9BACT|nr:helix-turn-helix domain-containing protein [Chitinophaga agrisoli]KAA2245436.1 helix-turn-helix domain-containing protein [Chitinophaga agrisoli]
MKRISIIVPKGAILGSIEGPRQVFTEVNAFLQSMGREPLFAVQLVSLTNEAPVYSGIYTVATNATIADVAQTDLIIIPALDADMMNNLEINRGFIPWIREQYKKGAEVASLCVGAFLLASTGLLNGRNCATHWLAANDFRRLFPEVNLVEDKIITDENGLYSSGGAFSYLNLILYLVGKFAGRDVAIFCSKAFQIDIERHSQSPFMIFKGQKEHEDDLIKQAQEFIEGNFQDRITVDDLAARVYLGRRNFERRFKKATANTVVEYIQRVKVEAAKKHFETSRKNINEVMFDVGYADVKAFRTIFRKITGLTPIEYRNKYNREAVVLEA